jgi:hypothetical protein
MMNFHEQDRSGRRRRIYARIADVSAWGGHRWAIGRYIGAGRDKSAPTDGRISLLNFIIGDVRDKSAPTVFLRI